jgi:hypothetical protein
MKICKKCGLDKPEKGRCKNCQRQYYLANLEKIKEQDKTRYENNKEAISKQKKNYYQNNKSNILVKNKEYYIDNKQQISEYHTKYFIANKETLGIKQKAYNEKNSDKIRENDNKYKRKRRATDINYKIRRNCSSMIWSALNGRKNSSILNYLPYTIQNLKEHLKSKFDDKMTWDNYGSYWHIDHIVPQSKLLYSSMEEDNFQKCWALSNLQPLEAIENKRKSNKVGAV